MFFEIYAIVIGNALLISFIAGVVCYLMKREYVNNI
jgi:hypothetical protein